MRYEPEHTIEILTKKFQTEIDPNKIISAIMSTEKANVDKVLNYIRGLVNKQKSKEWSYWL